MTQGREPKWSVSDNRIYFVRPSMAGQELWSVAIDGGDEQRVADLGTMRPIDVFFDISRDGILCWAPIRPGHQELWTATINNRTSLW